VHVYSDNALRIEDREALEVAPAGCLTQHTRKEWMEGETLANASSVV